MITNIKITISSVTSGLWCNWTWKFGDLSRFFCECVPIMSFQLLWTIPANTLREWVWMFCCKTILHPVLQSKWCFAHSILLFSRCPMPAPRNFSAQLQLKVRDVFLSTLLKMLWMWWRRCIAIPLVFIATLKFVWVQWLPCLYVVIFLKKYATAIMHYGHRADSVCTKHTSVSKHLHTRWKSLFPPVFRQMESLQCGELKRSCRLLSSRVQYVPWSVVQYWWPFGANVLRCSRTCAAARGEGGGCF